MKLLIIFVSLVVAGSLLAANSDVSPNPGTPGATDADFTELDMFELIPLGATERCVGVGFDGTNFWVTDAQSLGGNLWIHIISGDAAHTLITTVDQNNISSGWGLRDLCWDGTYMYGSQGNAVEYYDATYAKAGSYLCYACSPNRAQAWDGTYFYTGSFSPEIYQVTWDGVSGSTASYTTWSSAVLNGGTYGAAWDAAHNCLWVSTASYDGMLYQIDDMGVSLAAWNLDPQCNIAGGCTMGEYAPTDEEQLWVLDQNLPAMYCFDVGIVNLENNTWGAIKAVF